MHAIAHHLRKTVMASLLARGGKLKLGKDRRIPGGHFGLFIVPLSLVCLLLLIFANSPLAVRAAFPGANGKIAYSAYRYGGIPEIHVINTDGSNETRLTFIEGSSDLNPAWSPDGTKIVFTSDRDGFPNSEIYVMNADGSDQTNLTNNLAQDDLAAWSPDGSRIVFQSNRDGNSEIYVMDADGANPTRLTNNPANDLAPAWSPDGSKIAFQTDRDGNFEIYVMDANGNNPTNLTHQAATESGPDWSPDGTKIAFTSDRDGNAEIYAMDANGSNQTRLTNNSVGDAEPAWSPDGTKIVFQAIDTGMVEVYEMNADGSGRVAITNGAIGDGNPNWQPLPRATYSFSGFFQPVDNLPTLNIVKAGQAIPVKFSLNGDQGLNIFAAGYPKSQLILCSSTDPVDGIEETVAAGSSSLSYDISTDRYTYVWKTNKAWAVSCRQLVVRLNDGSSYRANFKFTR